MSHPTGETPVAEAFEVAPEAVLESAAEDSIEGAAEAGAQAEPAGDVAQTSEDNTIRNAAIGGVIGVFLVGGALIATALGLPVPWAGSGPDYGAAREIPISDPSNGDDDFEREWVPAYLLAGEAAIGDRGVAASQGPEISAVPTTTVRSADIGAPPVANDDTITIRADTTVNLYVLDNDRDADTRLADATVSSVSGPSHALRFSVEDDHFRYRPHRDRSERFVPEDSFVYEVCDSTGLCDRATVTILVVTT